MARLSLGLSPGILWFASGPLAYRSEGAHVIPIGASKGMYQYHKVGTIMLLENHLLRESGILYMLGCCSPSVKSKGVVQ